MGTEPPAETLTEQVAVAGVSVEVEAVGYMLLNSATELVEMAETCSLPYGEDARAMPEGGGY